MQNNTLTIRQARLQGQEGLWQIAIENGRFSRIEPQDAASSPVGQVLDAEGGLIIPLSLSRISIWIPLKRLVNRAGTSLVPYSRGLSAGLNVRRCSPTKMLRPAQCRR